MVWTIVDKSFVLARNSLLCIVVVLARGGSMAVAIGMAVTCNLCHLRVRIVAPIQNILFRCLGSCVICHMSCVTCHLSFVQCHVSRVTCHLSHITNANSNRPSPCLLPHYAQQDGSIRHKIIFFLWTILNQCPFKTCCNWSFAFLPV